ncbi:MAG: hypothetical protein K0R19_3339 [Bacillota bacterium]|nr:hypothetical protein [Bacillota bacterium]
MQEASTSIATPESYNTMTLTGQGRVFAQPDLAVIRLGVQTSGTDLNTIQPENAQITQNVLDVLKQAGIENIRTVQYTIDKLYDYENGTQIDRGFNVINLIEIRTDELDAVGRIIDTAVDAGANLIEMISFEASDPSIYYQQALNMAMMDAIEKARTLSRSLRLRTNLIPIKIVESGSVITPPMPYQRELASTPVIPGDITIEAALTAVFAY